MTNFYMMSDTSSKELNAGPNKDTHGLEIDTDEYMDAVELYNITARGPPFLFPLAKYLWFLENDEETCERINHLLMIAGWLAYKLTGKYIMDDTAAAETLLFDIRKRNWSARILGEFEISSEILPNRIGFAENLEEILPGIASQLELSPKTVAVITAADSQAALIGSGAVKKT
ncbi:MAG: FGGY family carbohydrate kinase [Candidatus Hodarchaeales archaeon]